MRDVSCKLLSKKYKEDNIGVQIPDKIQEIEIPIIKIEDIYAEEYYQAEQTGHKPNLRLRISRLNYENEQELIYMGKTYNIIRTSEITIDEIILICEEKIKNVKQS